MTAWVDYLIDAADRWRSNPAHRYRALLLATDQAMYVGDAGLVDR